MQPRRLLVASIGVLFFATSVIVACTGEDADAVNNPCSNPALCADSSASTDDGSPTTPESGASDGTAPTDGPPGDGGCTAPCNGDLMWLRSIGSNQGESVDRAVLDSTGNIYILGYAGAPLGLAEDGGAPNVVAAGRFVAKLDPDGKPLWAKTITGSIPKIDIAVAADGTLYVGGNYFRTEALTWGGADTTLPNNVGTTGYDIFLLKIGSDGVFQAQTRIGANNYDDFQAMSIVADGSPVIFGNCREAVTVGAMTIPIGAFAIKLNAATLASTWVHPISAANVNNVGGLGFASLSGGEIAMAARYSGPVTFRSGGSTSNPSSTGATDTFIGRLSGADGTMGNVQSSSMSIYGSNALIGSNTLLSSIAFFNGASPTIAVVGGFEGWVGLGSTNPALVVDSGAAKVPATFLALFNANSLLPVSYRAILDGPLPGSTKKFVAFDKDGNVTVAGTMKQDVEYGGGVLKTNGGVSDDGVVAHYGTAVTDHKWSARFGGSAIDRVAGMGVDPNNNIVLVGEFRATADFPPKKKDGVPETLMSKDAKPNIFVMKLAR